MKKACTEVKFMKAAMLFVFKQGFKMNVQEKLNFEFKVADKEKRHASPVARAGSVTRSSAGSMPRLAPSSAKQD
eukprot:536908-Pleurochrysis_carterae.AAC.2